MKMFDKHYATSEVAETVPLDIQLLLWTLIERRKEDKKEVDYLQVFNLSIIVVNGRKSQRILHSQEQPKISFIGDFQVFEPINAKFWVVDSGDGILMYPEQY